MSHSRLVALLASSISLLSVGCTQPVDAEQVGAVNAAVHSTLSVGRRASFLDVGGISISTEGTSFFKSVTGVAVTVDVSDYAEGGVSGYHPGVLKPGRLDVSTFGLADAADVLAWRRAAAQHKAAPKELTVVLHGLDGKPAVRLELHGVLPIAHDARSASGALHGNAADAAAFEFTGDEWQLLSSDAGVRLELANTLNGRLAVAGVEGAWVTSLENTAAPFDVSQFFSPNGAPASAEYRAVLAYDGAAAAYFDAWRSNPETRELVLVPECTQTGELACASVHVNQAQVVTSELAPIDDHQVELSNVGIELR